MFCAKNRLRKHQIFEKWDDFENRPSCQGYRLCKIVSLGQKLKLKKHAKNDFLMIELFCAKNRLRKHQRFGKWDDFEKRLSRKGFSLSKMFSLRQKWKVQKCAEYDARTTLGLVSAKIVGTFGNMTAGRLRTAEWRKNIA